jgi:hypothetical protein
MTYSPMLYSRDRDALIDLRSPKTFVMVRLYTRMFNQTLLKLRLRPTQKVLTFRFKAEYGIIIVRKKT